MGLINKSLLQRIADEQGINPKAVYPQVNRIVQETFLERDLAALVLASRLHINISKYSTSLQREAIRSQLSSTGERGSAASTANLSPPPSRNATRRARPNKLKTSKDNSVFVVHGRDEPLRKSMFAFLRALGLKPMEWSHAVNEAKGGNPYVGDIIETAMAKVQAVIVLLTPDEMAYLKEQFWAPGDRTGDGKPQGQPRPNVLFEAGLALGAHPDKTVLVQVGRVRAFSDIAGQHLVRLSNDSTKRNELANRLQKLGCNVNRVGSDWMTEGSFVSAESKRH